MRSGLIFSLIGASLLAISVLNVCGTMISSVLTSSNNNLKASLQEFISESDKSKTAVAVQKSLSEQEDHPGVGNSDNDDEKELESGDLPHLQHQQQRQQYEGNDIDSLQHRAHLSCEKHGGPEDEYAQEMVYWSDIPSDTRYVSPFHSKKGQHRRYLTFEPDGGGWNNIRMAMETVLGLGTYVRLLDVTLCCIHLVLFVS